MKKLLAPLATFTALTATATAADLPRRAPPPVFTPVPVFTWTGAYFGINAGYVFDGDTRFDRTVGTQGNNNVALAAGLRPVVAHVRDDGFTGGGQIGYNYQFGTGSGIVVGIEADAAYTDLNRLETFSNTTNLSAGVTPSASQFTRVNQYRGGLDFLGTVRGRLGYAFDRVLVYGTGGFAYGGVDNQVVFYGPNTATPFFVGRQNNIETGYAYGGGIEYAVPTDSFFSRLNFFNSSAVTVKVEYLHFELGNRAIPIPGVNGAPGAYAARVRNEGDLVRAGINYKFGTF
ncbi:porin family protein [Methylobacterium sp. J-030]|uniref:outer membrane protein n=1 Tax=Methylobacterium sp. J-030 TaxID=2836627 RepID=UPI001FB8AA83|nr:porin family protein [Methylobacterium sp. J-030]MCJ2069567.1 porin family protein [Methylobacterium sp. J-030]